MTKLFGKKTIIDRLGEAVGRKPKRSNTAVRSGLAAAGTRIRRHDWFNSRSS